MRTVGELVEAWLAHASTRLEVATVMSYRTAVGQCLPHIGAVPLADVSPAVLDALYVRLLADGRRASTVHRYHRALHAAFRQGVRWGWLATNPADVASPPRVHRRRIRPPSAADVVRLIDTAAPDLAVALRVLVATGMRRGEVCGLRWRDVDLAESSIRIETSVVHGETGLIEKDTKTHAARRLSLDAGTVAVLRAHRHARGRRAVGAGVVLRPDAFVLSDCVDGADPWRPNRLTHAFARLRATLGLDDVRLHDLRHFQATELIAAGVDVRTVAGRLGHADPSVTLKVYAAFMQPADEAAARVIEGLLRSGSPTDDRADHGILETWQ
ncbi:MAG: site-specific integrase [Acidimicrobiia bacterium]|nr:site-specific integrase [Acidimicrobiia bacterium]